MLRKLKNLLEHELDPAFRKRAEFIFQAIEAKQPKTVLDVGCGRGFYVRAFCEYKFINTIYGIDTNATYLAKAKKIINDNRIILKIGKIESLPFPDNSLDCVICSEILEHLPNDSKGLSEVRRILKPGGMLIISVPNKQFPLFWDPINWILMNFFNKHINKNIWWLAGMWADHVRLYSHEDILKKVKKHNFVINQVKHFVHFSWPFTHFLIYGVGKNIADRVELPVGNRFNFEKNNKASKFLAAFISLPSAVFDKYSTNKKKSVDIGLIAFKPE